MERERDKGDGVREREEDSENLLFVMMKISGTLYLSMRSYNGHLSFNYMMNRVCTHCN